MATLLLLCFMIYPNDIKPLSSDWQGSYQGTLELKSPGKPASLVPIALEIKPTDDAARVTWRITYGQGDKKSVRPYELVALPDRPHYYELDEKSGIKMQMHKVENKLYCLFKVSNSLLHVSYELNVKEGTIRYEISTYTEKDPLKTGIGKDGSSMVDSYQLISVQSALLKREDTATKGSSKNE